RLPDELRRRGWSAPKRCAAPHRPRGFLARSKKAAWKPFLAGRMFAAPNGRPRHNPWHKQPGATAPRKTTIADHPEAASRRVPALAPAVRCAPAARSACRPRQGAVAQVRPRLPQTGGERESERRRGWNRRTLQSIRPCSRPLRPAIASAWCFRSPVVGERLERVLLTSGTGVTESQNEDTRRPPPMTKNFSAASSGVHAGESRSGGLA